MIKTIITIVFWKLGYIYTRRNRNRWKGRYPEKRRGFDQKDGVLEFCIFAPLHLPCNFVFMMFNVQILSATWTPSHRFSAIASAASSPEISILHKVLVWSHQWSLKDSSNALANTHTPRHMTALSNKLFIQQNALTDQETWTYKSWRSMYT